MASAVALPLSGPGLPRMLQRRRRRADEPPPEDPAADDQLVDAGGAANGPPAGELPEGVLDAEGELVPPPTFIQEVIALHPMAYATVSARMIAASGSLTLCLIMHCFYLLVAEYPDEAASPPTPLLRLACSCRLVAAIPRPYAWWRIYWLHNNARKQSSSLRVAQRCLAASKDRWVRLNDALSRVYNVWLLCVAFRVTYGYFAEGERRSLFEQSLFGHTMLCVLSIASTHLLGAGAHRFAPPPSPTLPPLPTPRPPPPEPVVRLASIAPLLSARPLSDLAPDELRGRRRPSVQRLPESAAILTCPPRSMLCAGFMLMLIYYPHFYHDAEQTQQKAVLNRCSAVLTVDAALAEELSEDPCIICFDAFSVGDAARRLAPCNHLFHTACIDAWLERRLRSVPRLSCPVCSTVVGDEAGVEDSDPVVARDLAWLTELRRNHPGFFW